MKSELRPGAATASTRAGTSHESQAAATATPGREWRPAPGAHNGERRRLAWRAKLAAGGQHRCPPAGPSQPQAPEAGPEGAGRPQDHQERPAGGQRVSPPAQTTGARASWWWPAPPTHCGAHRHTQVQLAAGPHSRRRALEALVAGPRQPRARQLGWRTRLLAAADGSPSSQAGLDMCESSDSAQSGQQAPAQPAGPMRSQDTSLTSAAGWRTTASLSLTSGAGEPPAGPGEARPAGRATWQRSQAAHQATVSSGYQSETLDTTAASGAELTPPSPAQPKQRHQSPGARQGGSLGPAGARAAPAAQRNLVATLVVAYILVSLAVIAVLVLPYLGGYARLTPWLAGEPPRPPLPPAQWASQASHLLAPAAGPLLGAAAAAADQAPAAAVTQGPPAAPRPSTPVVARSELADELSGPAGAVARAWNATYGQPCRPLRVSFCLRPLGQLGPQGGPAGPPPGYAGYDQTLSLVKPRRQRAQLEQALQKFQPILDVRCYALMPLFLCTLYAPKCVQLARPAAGGPQTAAAQPPVARLVPPCRSVCSEALRKCAFFFEVLALRLAEPADCDSLPESDDPAVCVGGLESALVQRALAAPSCQPDQFRCLDGECIAAKWHCDGFADCTDKSDELRCSRCKPATEFHCGHDHCIPKRQVCDGVRNCRDGRDERQCLRLAKRLAGAASGRRLEVWLAAEEEWAPVCAQSWSAQPMADQACQWLGYAGAAAADHQNSSGRAPATSEARPASLAGLLESGALGACRSAPSQHVYLHCRDYQCGRSAASHNWQQAAKLATSAATAAAAAGNQGGRPRSRRLVVGGVESAPGDFPYLAALHGGPDEVFFCGGVLISARWLLTAAHCVGNRTRPEGWTVKVGVTRRIASPAAARKLQVSRIIKHPRFNEESLFNNDIALIELEQALDFDHYLGPICLPGANWQLDLLDQSAAGAASRHHCVVVGFGKPKFSQEANYLRAAHHVAVPIVAHATCAGWYAEHGVQLTDGMLCAGYPEGKRDACQGDSGSGLFCRRPNSSQLYVAGVVSFGIKCATPKLPGIYTSVPRYVDWILDTMRQHERPAA